MGKANRLHTDRVGLVLLTFISPSADLQRSKYMTILRDIRAAELAQVSHRATLLRLQEENTKLEEMLNVELEKKVVLDLTKDPDPYGYHKVSLVDRLRAMGWPE